MWPQLFSRFRISIEFIVLSNDPAYHVYTLYINLELVATISQSQQQKINRNCAIERNYKYNAQAISNRVFPTGKWPNIHIHRTKFIYMFYWLHSVGWPSVVHHSCVSSGFARALEPRWLSIVMMNFDDNDRPTERRKTLGGNTNITHTTHVQIKFQFVFKMCCILYFLLLFAQSTRTAMGSWHAHTKPKQCMNITIKTRMIIFFFIYIRNYCRAVPVCAWRCLRSIGLRANH